MSDHDMFKVMMASNILWKNFWAVASLAWSADLTVGARSVGVPKGSLSNQTVVECRALVKAT